MNYVESLTLEEKSIICGIITGRAFKELFMKEELELLKINKGFSVKAMSEELALSTAISNVDSPFISTYINKSVDAWIKEIKENINKLESEGALHDIALATTLLDSFFVNNVDLYLKLVGQSMDADAYSKLCSEMECIKSERTRSPKAADDIRSIEDEKLLLLTQIEAMQQSIYAIKEEYEQKILKIEQDKINLEASLIEAQERIAELQAIPSAVRSDNPEYIALFDDTDSSVLPSVDGDEIISLCGFKLINGQKRLVRYADLNHNGHYQIFRKSKDVPPYFVNRENLFYKDGPCENGFYGIWNWSAVPNINDSSKDYISSQFNSAIDAIEVVIITETSNLDELIKMLKFGVEFKPHSRKIMFSLYVSNGQYMGVLLNAKGINTINGKTTFAEDCNVAPIYEFVDNDILRLDN
ncbi:MAG: hypothetical protein Q4C01_00345 [Clostridia bacterium]|nr:hypothetical protein [Clostridia bacterium]